MRTSYSPPSRNSALVAPMFVRVRVQLRARSTQFGAKLRSVLAAHFGPLLGHPLVAEEHDLAALPSASRSRTGESSQ